MTEDRDVSEAQEKPTWRRALQELEFRASRPGESEPWGDWYPDELGNVIRSEIRDLRERLEEVREERDEWGSEAREMRARAWELSIRSHEKNEDLTYVRRQRDELREAVREVMGELGQEIGERDLPDSALWWLGTLRDRLSNALDQSGQPVGDVSDARCNCGDDEWCRICLTPPRKDRRSDALDGSEGEDCTCEVHTDRGEAVTLELDLDCPVHDADADEEGEGDNWNEQAVTHGLERVTTGNKGRYKSICECGWSSTWRDVKMDADADWLTHRRLATVNSPPTDEPEGEDDGK